jgi:hypothetical protein
LVAISILQIVLLTNGCKCNPHLHRCQSCSCIANTMITAMILSRLAKKSCSEHVISQAMQQDWQLASGW